VITERRKAGPVRGLRRREANAPRAGARERFLRDREDALRASEQALNLREQRELQRQQTCADLLAHISLLQQANAHLVVASLDAVALAEQVQLAKDQLDFQANHDVLTKLPNRALLASRLQQAIDVARGRHGKMAIMFIDLDRFKHINDSLGHAVGDLLLQAIAESLVACVRSSDTVSRQGGDEFVLLLPAIDDAGDAVAIAEKVLRTMALPHLVEQHLLHVGVSIGISLYPQDGTDAAALIGNADLAMYQTKDSGRNHYTFYAPYMNARAVLRQSTETGLHLALARHEFVLHYQPKIALGSGMLVGVEALIRWQHPERGLLAPRHFVAIAEESGLILPMGRWVLRHACEQAIRWSADSWPPLVMAVNMSPLEFIAANFMVNLRQTLADTGLPPECLELELTEGMLMRDADLSSGLLRDIANLGVKLAIDDFGTGYSSLSYLSQFPIHTLKIDQSFVSQMSTSSDDATIVSAVIGMGKNLNKRVIAEGVETQEQYAFLQEQGCDEGQGFFFGRPTDAAGIAAMLRRDRSAPRRLGPPPR
jgi:diguanylate cyclase (GGDEF)-like protein